MKKFFSLLVLQTLAYCSLSQTVLYSNSFNNLTLQTNITASVVTQYATVPNSFLLINDALHNNTGSASNPNKPFNAVSPDTTGWAVVYNAFDKDTFLVSTSWTSTTGIAVDRWIVTPTVAIQTASRTVLTWLAKSPDASYPDGYEVYNTTNMSTSLTAANFPLGDRMYPYSNTASSSGEKSEWTRRSAPILNSVSALRFAFRNNSKDMYQLWIDDIQVIEFPHVRDAAIAKIETEKYVLINSFNRVHFYIQNNAAAAINTITLDYQVDGSVVQTETFTFSNGINYAQIDTASLPLPAWTSSVGLHTIKSWISSVNGAADENNNNDVAYFNVSVQDVAPPKTVMMEQFVSVNDGQNPWVQEKANALLSNSVVMVNIHEYDSLQEATSSSFINEYGEFTSTALFDRCYFKDLRSAAVVSNDYATYSDKRKTALTPVTVGITGKSYNETTRELSFTVNAHFVADAKGDYRMNAYLLENNVCGAYTDTTNNGYNQVNGYYNIEWLWYYHFGYYVPTADVYVMSAWQYKQQNVLVHTFDGFYGSAGLIPNNGGTQNQNYQQTFTYTVPVLTNTNVGQKCNPDNLYIVAFVDEYDTDKNNRTVLNCVKEKVKNTPEYVGMKEHSISSEVLVYPNPSSGLFYVKAKENVSDAEIKIYDLLGNCLKTQTITQSKTLDLSSLPQGVYFLRINSSEGSFSKKIVIQKN